VTSSHTSTSAVYDPSIEPGRPSPINAREPNMYWLHWLRKFLAELALVAVGIRISFFCEGATEPRRV
jgi:hypothetical protein